VAQVSAFVEVNGVKCTGARVLVPGNGVWAAWVSFDDTTTITDARAGAVLTIGQTTFRGTYDPAFSGTFGLRRQFLIVAGGGGWRKKVKTAALHNDAGVRLSTVVQGIAGEVGETIANLTDRRLGPKFTRLPVAASAHMNALVGPWYVDYAGVTQCRAPQGGTIGEHELLEYRPQAREAVLATMNPGNIPLGSTITTRLDAPLVVRALEITVEEDAARVLVWGT
jgi:hypothetical protein